MDRPAACASQETAARTDFAFGLRRGELAALEVGRVEFCNEGARLRVVRSNTDLEGRGEVVSIVATGSPTCPVAALRSWMQAVWIAEGPVFRSIDRHGRLGPRLSHEAVGLIVKRRAEAVGLDPAAFSGHSLRSGHATEAASAGVEERDIARQTRHRSIAVLRRYIREGSVFVRNSSARIGL